MTPSSFYQRPLPETFVAFASDEGRRVFREALDEGNAEGFFALAEQFHTQADPAFCGLGSLVVVLNALGIDPGRLWKGPWRWFSEELLDCCVPLEEVRQKGLTMDELGCLARCNGALVRVERGGERTAEEFRAAVREATRAPRGPILVASYDRGALGQTGSGHFSPIGAFHEQRDLVLLLDVARFKYPPHWVPLARLFEATRTTDTATGTSRGWLAFEARKVRRQAVFALSANMPLGELLGDVQARLAASLPQAKDARDALARFAEAALPTTGATGATGALAVRAPSEGGSDASAVLEALRSTEVHAALRDPCAVAAPDAVDAASVLALVLPDGAWQAAPVAVRDALVSLLRRGRAVDDLGEETAVLREQVEALGRLAACRTAACRR